MNDDPRAEATDLHAAEDSKRAPFRTEEEATGFVTFVDNLIVERDTAQAGAAELRVEVKRLKADNKRNRDLAAKYRSDLITTRKQRDAWAYIATDRADEINDLHAVIAGLRGQIGIRP